MFSHLEGGKREKVIFFEVANTFWRSDKEIIDVHGIHTG